MTTTGFTRGTQVITAALGGISQKVRLNFNFANWPFGLRNCLATSVRPFPRFIWFNSTSIIRAESIRSLSVVPIKDEERCLKAGVPKDKIKAPSKIDFARELIEQADAHGVQYARIGLDSFYGRDNALLCWIEDRGGEFYGDIPENTYIWLDQPAGDKRPLSPAKHGAVKVCQLSNNKDAWKKSKRIKIRNGENGPVIVDSLVRRVWVWPTEEGPPRQWWLLISKDKGGKIKHTLSNAPSNTPQEQLARHQGQRHFIERNFQNSKSHLGMADYQARKWSGWHRHMAMVALAGLFVMEKRMLNHKAHPLLSTRDVVQILDWYFRENPRLDSIIEQIENRHHRRKRVSKSKSPPKTREKSHVKSNGVELINNSRSLGSLGINGFKSASCIFLVLFVAERSYARTRAKD